MEQERGSSRELAFFVGKQHFPAHKPAQPVEGASPFSPSQDFWRWKRFQKHPRVAENKKGFSKGLSAVFWFRVVGAKNVTTAFEGT